jgi:hypothetical protein
MNIFERHARFYMTYALDHREDWDWFDQEWSQIQRAWSNIKRLENSLCIDFLLVFDRFLDRRSLVWDEIDSNTSHFEPIRCPSM